ncbi:MAG: hypothetical protein AB4352_11595 [Hormoscilla sp.]
MPCPYKTFAIGFGAIACGLRSVRSGRDRVGAQKPGFFVKYGVRMPKLSQKPGFLLPCF